MAEQYVGRVSVYRVDIDPEMPRADRFGINGIPTVLIFRNGKEAERLDGLITEDDLKAAFGRATRPYRWCESSEWHMDCPESLIQT